MVYIVDAKCLLACCLVLVGFDCLGNNQRLCLSGLGVVSEGLAEGVYAALE